MGVHDRDQDLASLVAAAKEGDRAALDEVCARCYDQVLFYFQQRIPAQAEDLTQRLFAELPRKLAGYTESGRFRAWLQGVAYNMFLTQNRSNQRRREDTLRTEIDLADTETTTLFRTAKGELRRLVLALPPTLREAWELFAEGRSHSEIAAELGISPGAAATRVSRARTRLLEMLSPPSTRSR